MTKPKETADGGEVNRKEVVVVTAGEVEEGGQRAGAEWGLGWVGGRGIQISMVSLLLCLATSVATDNVPPFERACRPIQK